MTKSQLPIAGKETETHQNIERQDHALLAHGLNPNASSGAHSLSDEETRQILTPFAFKMDHSLFGLPLASPAKRVMAIAIDLLFVALLSDMPGEILALVVSIVLYRLGSKKRGSISAENNPVKGRKRRSFLRFIGIFVIFIVLVTSLPDWITSVDNLLSHSKQKQEPSIVNVGGIPVPNEQSLRLSAIMIAGAAKIALSECENFDCWAAELVDTEEALYFLAPDEKLFMQSLSSLIANTNLTKLQQKQLLEQMSADYQLEHSSENSSEKSSEQLLSKSVVDITSTKTSSTGPAQSEKPVESAQSEKSALAKMAKKADPDEKSTYSMIELAKGMVEDLGLGFGWAAFYFTCFTALWQGQTPGKKLFKIKVLQLDGTPLSMWDSFGRYGGYVAGFATGLLGFLQIYWDPNRQAIHDRISATVVIDLSCESRK